jgi:hypothetical protein
MERSSTPDRLSSGRPQPRNLLNRLGSMGVMSGFSRTSEEIRVIETSHRESSETDLAIHDAMSARAFEASGLYRPDADTEPELLF